MDYSYHGNLLEDKFFFIFRVENLRGKLVTNFKEGKNIWLTEKEILRQEDVFDDVPEIIQALKQERISFKENKFTVSGY